MRFLKLGSRSIRNVLMAVAFILACTSLILETIEHNYKTTCAIPTKIFLILNPAIHLFATLYMIFLALPCLSKQAKVLLDNFFDVLFGAITFPIIILGAILQIINLFITPRCLTVPVWALLYIILLVHYQISCLAYPKLKLCWQIYQEKQRETNQLIALEIQERDNQSVRRENQPSVFDILIRGDYLEACDLCNTSFNHKETIKILKIEQIFAGEKERKRMVCPECEKKISN